VSHDIPNDARAIVGGRDSLSVVLVDSDFVNTATVFLEGALHNLGLARDSPDTNFTFLTTGNDSLAVVGWHKSSNSVVVGIVDSIEQLTRLGEEGTDLAIGPARDNALTVSHEGHSIALKSRNLNTEEFLASKGVPDTNVVFGASGEKFREASGEGNSVDLFVVASITELGADLISVAPVEGGFGSTSEEVGLVGSQGNRCNRSHNFGLGLDVHANSVDLCDTAITSTDEQVTVLED
jgi:hypothetical protein